LSADLIRRPEPKGKGAANSFDRFVVNAFTAIDNAADSLSVTRAVNSARDVLSARRLSFRKLADAAIQSGILKDELPHELADDASMTVTSLELMLRRHRHVIGLAGEVSLSSSIDKLRRGIKLDQLDHARIRDARSRARLALQMGGPA
jgi:hypothetical protein